MLIGCHFFPLLNTIFSRLMQTETLQVLAKKMVVIDLRIKKIREEEKEEGGKLRVQKKLKGICCQKEEK